MECPQEPDQSECCNSGCNPCIFDVYEQQLQKFRKQEFESFPRKENCLKVLKYTEFKLVDMIGDSKQGNIYIFECNSHVSASSDEGIHCNVFCEPGQHLLIKGKSKNDQSEFSRAYTPIPWDGIKKSQFAMLIKLYKDGEMSKFFKRLKIDEITCWRGPYGDYQVDFNLENVLMIAQGTGIAPLYAIIKKMLNNDECYTKIKLVYCCRDLDSTHLRNQLYKLQEHWNFKYEVFLSQLHAENEVKYAEVVHNQKLDENHVESLLKDVNDVENVIENCQVLICGTNIFTASIENIIKKYSNVCVHCF